MKNADGATDPDGSLLGVCDGNADGATDPEGSLLREVDRWGS